MIILRFLAHALLDISTTLLLISAKVRFDYIECSDLCSLCFGGSNQECTECKDFNFIFHKLD